MPTVLRSGTYRFYFYSDEPNEPMFTLTGMICQRSSGSIRWHWLRLFHATAEQRSNWKIAGGGYGIHRPEIDEDISTEGLLRGAPAPRVGPATKV